jgi:SAM-dependent methyltransferase
MLSPLVLGPLRRKSAQRTPEPAARILDELIDREEVIDRFDASYLDDLPAILREVHGLDDARLAGHRLEPRIAELWELSGRPRDELALADLPRVLVEEVGVDPAEWSPREAPKSVRQRYGHDRVRSWRSGAGRRVAASAPEVPARDIVNTMQAEYSIQSGGDRPVEFGDLARPETGDPWTPLMRELRERGDVREDEPVLTIGPRWVGEIHYFRDEIGLRGTIGLDLFTPDDELIKVGDMHDMPFEDGTFGLVYQRNTFDKSYDIRAALRECVRVLRDGGILVSDDCYAYTDGVSEMSRTSLKHNRQIVRAIEPHVAEVIYDRETDSNESWIERVGQLAVRVRK